MSDCIVAQITANIVAALKTITTTNGYSFTAAKVEEERISMRTNGAMPYIEVCGPEIAVISDGGTQCREHDLSYEIFYYNKINDDDLTSDPAPRQTNNIAADLQKCLMDKAIDGSGYPKFQRGGLAENTIVTNYGYDTDIDDDDTPIFVVGLAFRVRTILNLFDPYLKG